MRRKILMMLEKKLWFELAAFNFLQFFNSLQFFTHQQIMVTPASLVFSKAGSFEQIDVEAIL